MEISPQLINIYVYIIGVIWIVKPKRSFTTLQEYIFFDSLFEEKQMLTGISVMCVSSTSYIDDVCSSHCCIKKDR